MDEKWCRGQEIKIGTCGRVYTRVTLAVLQQPMVDSDGQIEQTMRTDDLHIMTDSSGHHDGTHERNTRAFHSYTPYKGCSSTMEANSRNKGKRVG